MKRNTRAAARPETAAEPPNVTLSLEERDAIDGAKGPYSSAGRAHGVVRNQGGNGCPVRRGGPSRDGGSCGVYHEAAVQIDEAFMSADAREEGTRGAK